MAAAHAFVIGLNVVARNERLEVAAVTVAFAQRLVEQRIASKHPLKCSKHF
jgi:hypothetical protein